MFGEFETRDTDYRVEKPYRDDRRHQSRRQSGTEEWGSQERRMDADWRFAIVRKTMRHAMTRRLLNFA
jgi:hypothetical protein